MNPSLHQIRALLDSVQPDIATAIIDRLNGHPKAQAYDGDRTTNGPADGGLARANAKAEAARLARKAEAAERGPRSNSGAAAARAALALHPDQGAA